MTGRTNGEVYVYPAPEDRELPGRLDLRPAGGPLIAYNPVSNRAEIVSEPGTATSTAPADTWDLKALGQLSPADRIDYITDRLAADFKNKTPNVLTAIGMLRNVAEELREAERVGG